MTISSILIATAFCVTAIMALLGILWAIEDPQEDDPTEFDEALTRARDRMERMGQ